MKEKVSIPFMLLGILFNVCLIAANLLETKVIQVGSITVTAGLLVFPISYIINDCIAEVWGFKKARLIIWSGFAMNFFVVALGLIAVAIPAAPFWEGEEHFDFVFGMAPRIVFASLMAFLVGSFLNAYVMSKMKVASGGKNFSARCYYLYGCRRNGGLFYLLSCCFWWYYCLAGTVGDDGNPNRAEIYVRGYYPSCDNSGCKCYQEDRRQRCLR